MTPAYPKMQQSYVNGVYVTKMKLFNRREDVEYYEIQVFTNEWKPLPFASTSKVLNVGHNRRKLFEVYIRSSDLDKATYICTESKVFKNTEQVTLVSSKICSKIKQDK
tara:strand:- start:142 stop:465 length:324 start_codon:yes stop_codon:yes gene_type:complete